MKKDSKGDFIFEVGDVVKVRSGSTKQLLKAGNIASVSKTQKVITVDYGKARSVKFYRDSSLLRYVANPGAGLLGSMLNDFFYPYEVKTPGV